MRGADIQASLRELDGAMTSKGPHLLPGAADYQLGGPGQWLCSPPLHRSSRNGGSPVIGYSFIHTAIALSRPGPAGRRG